ncbi:MAG: hypothetical protein JO223_20850 [Hyphomicrobiales bacterium]|nr:hypothetical protein [Hyphomicrobiales bacterium]
MTEVADLLWKSRPSGELGQAGVVNMCQLRRKNAAVPMRMRRLAWDLLTLSVSFEETAGGSIASLSGEMRSGWDQSAACETDDEPFCRLHTFVRGLDAARRL